MDRAAATRSGRHVAAVWRRPHVDGAARAAGGGQPPSVHKPLPPDHFVVHEAGAEMRWETMRGRGFVVPTDRFFALNHTRTPTIDRTSWRLRVHGAGLARSDALELTYDQLVSMPTRTLTAAIECAGNGRRFFGDQQGTPAEGTPWGLGAIGVARWRGVALADIPDRAHLRPAAVDVMAEGLDPRVIDDSGNHGHVQRPLPVDKACDDVLVAYEMNGQELPPDHGFPARLVVPARPGIASIKWLGAIKVSDRPLRSSWNTRWYRLPDGHDGSWQPITAQPVDSALELPWGARIPAGRPTALHGRSWSGHAPIDHVDLSVDRGRSWRRVTLEAADIGRTWTRWRASWTPGASGPSDLMVRGLRPHGRAPS